MNDGLWQLTLADFREQTASAQPTPGGGSVCSVSASFGLGLVVMALEITKRRCTSELAQPLTSSIARARALLLELATSAEADVQAFARYVAAQKLPHADERARALRDEALRASAHEATEVPLAAARQTLAGLELAAEAALLSSLHVISDVLAGAELLHAAVAGLVATLTMNLRADSDLARVQSYQQQRDEISRHAARVIVLVRARVDERHAAQTPPALQRG